MKQGVQGAFGPLKAVGSYGPSSKWMSAGFLPGCPFKVSCSFPLSAAGSCNAVHAEKYIMLFLYMFIFSKRLA